MKKRTLTLILTMLLLLSSCGGTTDVETIPEAETTAQTVAETETERMPALPDDLDYGGREYNIVTGYFTDYCYITREESTGEVLNDAIYDMVINTETRLNVDIIEQSEDVGQLPTLITNMTSAGDDTYEVANQLVRFNTTLLLSGILRPFSEAGYVDMTAPWWSPELNKQLEVGGYLWFASSASNVNLYASTSSIFVNTTLANQFAIDVEELYTAVREGNWTQDMMMSYASVVTTDLDGNETMDENDRYGLVCHDDNILGMSLIAGGGGQALTRDETGKLIRDWDSERYMTLIENAYNIFHSEDYSHAYDRYIATDFAAGLALFMHSIFSGIDGLSEMEDDYTLLPVPKYDASQDRYVCCSYDCPMTYSFPKSTSDMDFSGAVLEWLTYEGKKGVEGAYIETTMKFKKAREESMAEMVQICLDSAMIDLGSIFAYDMCSYDALYAGVMVPKTFKFASYKETKNKSLDTVLENLAAALEKNLE